MQNLTHVYQLHQTKNILTKMLITIKLVAVFSMIARPTPYIQEDI